MAADVELEALADQVRRAPESVRAMALHPVVAARARHWRVAEDLLNPGAEMALAAWLVRRKAQWVLPPPQPPPPEPKPEPDRSWVPVAVAALARLRAAAVTRWGRPAPAFSPGVDPPPVAGADPVRLSRAWPPRPRVRPSRPGVVVRQDRTLERAVTALRQRLAAGPVVFPWPGIGGIRAQVDWFAALLWLWGEGEVELVQTRPFAPVEVRRR
ncbi:MAG: hypothetical protein K6U14_03650 [Firmicutes bacterium]|nr:hypothetical protein [Alicyclobacillaceae bacterium]MCL6496715.1 hypothetical protein [Bacillota bacterium]